MFKLQNSFETLVLTFAFSAPSLTFASMPVSFLWVSGLPVFAIDCILSSALSFTLLRNPEIFRTASGEAGLVKAHIRSYSRCKRYTLSLSISCLGVSFIKRAIPGLATNSFLFCFLFVKKSLICLEGKSMNSHRETLFSSVPPHCNTLKPRLFAAFPSLHPFFYFAPFCLQKDDIRTHKRGRTGAKKRQGSINFTIMRYS